MIIITQQVFCQQTEPEITIEHYFFPYLFNQEIITAYVMERAFGKVYKYYQIAELSLEDLSQREKFLTDYHVIRYLSGEAKTDKATVGRLAVALSNLFRICREYGIEELHFTSLRIIKKYDNLLNKDIFIITEY